MRGGSRNKTILPIDIVEQILSKIPIESLIRLKSVCKDWRSLIRRFVNCYHKELLKTTDNRLLVLVSRFDIYTIGIDEIDGKLRRVVAKKICRNAYGFGLIGSCNGLLCFTNKKHKLSLYNPSTQMDRLVLHLDMKTLAGKVEHKVFGFGYDASSDDYKIVRILWLCLKNASGITSQVEVYSLRNKSWKTVERILYEPNIETTTHGVFVDNALHWLVVENSPSSLTQIVSFDLGLEKFSLVAQPIRQTDKQDYMTVHALNGCLALCIRPSGYFETDIWVMKRYGIQESWTRMFTIDAALEGRIKPIALSNDESKVLLTTITYPSLISWGDFWWFDVNGNVSETGIPIVNSYDGLKVETFLGNETLMNKEENNERKHHAQYHFLYHILN